jgi:hypothetical protein
MATATSERFLTTIGARLRTKSQETSMGVYCADALIVVYHEMRKTDSHQSLVSWIARKKNIPETEEETEQHSTNDYLSFQSSDSINSDDTSTKTISAENGANNADNEAITNTGHTAEHNVKAASDHVNVIQNAHISFNLA